MDVLAGTEQGHRWLGLRGPRAELRLVPALGGRIIALQSRATGRQWCWRQPRPDWLWANRPGDSFGQSPQAGVDECIPTVAPCHLDGVAYADHGEAWHRPWDLDPVALEAGILAARVDLAPHPLAFSRNIRVDADGSFRFDYRVENLGSAEQPWLWCLHPLLALQEGDRLLLPPEVCSLRLNGGVGAPMRLGDVVPWPEPFPGVRLDALQAPGMPGGCLKGFAGPLETGRAAVVNDRSGDRFELRWDPAAAPWLGVWLNRGFQGFHHLGLEPATGAPDALADAAELWNACPRLAPGAVFTWRLNLDIA